GFGGAGCQSPGSDRRKAVTWQCAARADSRSLCAQLRKTAAVGAADKGSAGARHCAWIEPSKINSWRWDERSNASIIFIMDQAKSQRPIGSPRRTFVIMPFSCCSMILQKSDGTDFHL